MVVSLTTLLKYHVLKEDIQNVNRNLGVRVSGTKAELIEILLVETDRSPKGTLRLFTKPILQDICRKLDLSRSGTKEQIIARIIDSNEYSGHKTVPDRIRMLKSRENIPHNEEAMIGNSGKAIAPKIRLIPRDK